MTDKDKKSEELVPMEQSQAVQLGSMPMDNPGAVIQRATEISKELVKIINDQHLYTVISDKKYVQVTGWSALGAMLGVLPREVSAHEFESGDVEAVVELIRTSDGAVVGRGSAIVGMEEKDRKGNLTWANRPRYARRSMAITRATGKAFRLSFSWIMSLAGYQATPAEEMDGIIVDSETTDERQKKKEETKVEYPRPWEAEFLREQITIKVNKHKPFTATDEMVGLTAAMIEYAFMSINNSGTRESMRHTVTKYLIGKASLKEATGQEISVLLFDWLKPVKDSGGASTPDHMAVLECEKVYTAANIALGQINLPEEK